MLNKFYFIFIVLCVVSAYSGCDGGGGGGSESASKGLSFQAGLPPENIAGVYKITNVTESMDTCGGNTSASDKYFEIEQDGSKATLTASGDENEYTGEVSKNSFKLVMNNSSAYGECHFSASAEVVGAVTGSDLTMTAFVTITSSGCEGMPANCSIKILYAGAKTTEPMPTGEASHYGELPNYDTTPNYDTMPNSVPVENSATIKPDISISKDLKKPKYLLPFFGL